MPPEMGNGVPDMGEITPVPHTPLEHSLYDDESREVGPGRATRRSRTPNRFPDRRSASGGEEDFSPAPRPPQPN